MLKKAAVALLFIALLVACNGQGRIITPVTTDLGSIKTLTPISSPFPMLEPSPTSACSPIFSPVGFWPDSSHIVGLLTVEGQSKTWLQVLDLQSLTVQTILKVDQLVNVAAFSPDRTILAWALPDFSVQLVTLAEGKAASPFTGHSDVVNALVFSPDGSRLYTAGRDKNVLVWADCRNSGENVVSTAFCAPVPLNSFIEIPRVFLSISREPTLDVMMMIALRKSAFRPLLSVKVP